MLLVAGSSVRLPAVMFPAPEATCSELVSMVRALLPAAIDEPLKTLNAPLATWISVSFVASSRRGWLGVQRLRLPVSTISSQSLTVVLPVI